MTSPARIDNAGVTAVRDTRSPMETPSTRSGVLILRVWVESGREDGFRARIIQTLDGQQEPPTAVSKTADVLAAVRTWLDELLERDG